MTIHLAEMTMEEFRSKLDESTVVILPVGILEGHGRHLPLATDTIQAEYVCEQIAQRTGAWLAPTVNYGNCGTTSGLPGSVSVSFDTMRDFIADILFSFARHGVRRMVVLSGHAGRAHMTALRQAGQRVVDEFDIKLMVLSDYDLAYDTDRFQDAVQFPDDGGMGHGGFIETARVMHIRPDLVRGEGIPTSPQFKRFRIVRDAHRLFPEGNMGDPTTASAEAGAKLDELIVEDIAALVRELAEEP